MGGEIKSKISIWDCRRAIEIADGIPLTIRGALFVDPGPDLVAHWLSETVLVTQLEIKQSRWTLLHVPLAVWERAALRDLLGRIEGYLDVLRDFFLGSGRCTAA